MFNISTQLIIYYGKRYVANFLDTVLSHIKKRDELACYVMWHMDHMVLVTLLHLIGLINLTPLKLKKGPTSKIWSDVANNSNVLFVPTPASMGQNYNF